MFVLIVVVVFSFILIRLLLVVLLVELLLYDGSVEHLLPYLYFQLCSELCVSGIDEGHGHRLVNGYAVVARGDFSYRLAPGIQYCISVAWYGLVLQLYSHQFPGYAIGLLLSKCLLADEFLAVEGLSYGCESGRESG